MPSAVSLRTDFRHVNFAGWRSRLATAIRAESSLCDGQWRLIVKPEIITSTGMRQWDHIC